MIRFEDYKDRFKCIRLERHDGILEVTLHRDGGQAVWDAAEGGIHDEFGAACYFIGRDPDTKVMILTHAGECPFEKMAASAQRVTTEFWDRILKEGKDLLMNLLEIDVPVIAAVSGNTFIHAELFVLSNIVIAGDDTRFADKAHMCSGIPPADGVHVVWPMLLGPNRGRHFLLTGAEIDASEALRLGVVAEVLPKNQVLERAREIARELGLKPRLTLRYARLALIQDIKRRLLNELGYGLALEGLGVLGLTNSKRD